MCKAWRLCILCLLLSAAFFPWSGAFAFGPHDKLKCTDCHAAHVAGDGNKIRLAALNGLASAPEERYVFTGVRTLCMSCHKNKIPGVEKMGIGTVCAIHNRREKEAAGVSVPASLLRRGKIRCDSCHDPHGTNPNHEYLIVKTKGKRKNLCAMCHGRDSYLHTTVKKPKKIKKQKT